MIDYRLSKMTFDTGNVKPKPFNVTMLARERRRLLIQYNAPNFMLDEAFKVDEEKEVSFNVHPTVLEGLKYVFMTQPMSQKALGDIIAEFKQHIRTIENG